MSEIVANELALGTMGTFIYLLYINNNNNNNNK